DVRCRNWCRRSKASGPEAIGIEVDEDRARAFVGTRTLIGHQYLAGGTDGDVAEIAMLRSRNRLRWPERADHTETAHGRPVRHDRRPCLTELFVGHPHDAGAGRDRRLVRVRPNLSEQRKALTTVGAQRHDGVALVEPANDEIRDEQIAELIEGDRRITASPWQSISARRERAAAERV